MLLTLSAFGILKNMKDFYFLDKEIVKNPELESRNICGGLNNYGKRTWHGPPLPEYDSGLCTEKKRVLVTGCSGNIGSSAVMYVRRIMPAATIICLENDAQKKSDTFLNEWQADRNNTRTNVVVFNSDLADLSSIPNTMSLIGKVDYAILTSAIMLVEDTYQSAETMLHVNTLSPLLIVKNMVTTGNTRVIALVSRAAEIRYDECDPKDVIYAQRQNKKFGTWTWYGCTKRFQLISLLHLSNTLFRGTQNSMVVMHPGAVNYKASENKRGTSLIPFGGFQDFRFPPSEIDFLNAAVLDGFDHPSTVSATIIYYLLTDENMDGTYNSIENDLVRKVRASGPKVVPPEWRAGTVYQKRVITFVEEYLKRFKQNGAFAVSYSMKHPYTKLIDGFSDDAVPIMTDNFMCQKTFDNISTDFESNSGLLPFHFNNGPSNALAGLPSWVVSLLN